MPFNDRTIDFIFVTNGRKKDYIVIPSLLRRYTVKKLIVNDAEYVKNLKAAKDAEKLDQRKVYRFENTSLSFVPLRKYKSNTRGGSSTLVIFEENKQYIYMLANPQAKDLNILSEQFNLKGSVVAIFEYGLEKGLFFRFLVLAEPRLALISEAKQKVSEISSIKSYGRTIIRNMRNEGNISLTL